MTKPKFAVGDWVCESPYDHEWDEIYQIKDVAWDMTTGCWWFSLEGHEYNGHSEFNDTKDYYFSEGSLMRAPESGIKEVVFERATNQILTQLSDIDILELIPDDLTPSQCSRMMPTVSEIAELSGLARSILRG